MMIVMRDFIREIEGDKTVFMNEQHVGNGHTIGGTLGGLLLVLFNVEFGDIVHTAVLAGIGAAVSFMVSFGLNALASWIRQRWLKK